MTLANTPPCYEDLKIVDSDGTVLFDLDTGLGSSADLVASALNPHDVKTSSEPAVIGRLPVNLSQVVHGAGIPGGMAATKDYGFRTFGVTVTIEASSVLNADRAANELLRLVDEGSVNGNRILYVTDSTLPDRYVRWLGANELPPLIEDRAITLLRESNIVTVNLALVAQPLLERDVVAGTPTTVDADPAGTNGRVMVINNPGSGPAHVKVKARPTAATLTHLRLGLLSGDLASTYAAGEHFEQAENGTPSGGAVALATNADASGGASNNVLRFTPSGTSTALRYFDTITDIESLRGRRFRVLLHMLLSAAFVGEVQLSWGLGANRIVAGNDAVALNLSGGGSDVDLGVVAIPEDWESFYIAISAGRTSGTGNLDFDFVSFLPVDEAALLVASDSLGVTTAQAFVLEPAGQGEPPAAYVATSATGVPVGSMASLVGDNGFWIPPGNSAVYVWGGIDDANLLTYDLEMTFDITPHDLLA